MRNHIKAICVCVLLGGTLLSAQSRVVATVPFDFVVRNHLLPAGVYSISVDAERNAVLIRGEEANAIFALTHAAQSGTIGTDAKLVFKRYGDRYFLSQVWPAATDQGRQLLVSKMEQELARKVGKPEIVAVLVGGTKVPRAAR